MPVRDIRVERVVDKDLRITIMGHSGMSQMIHLTRKEAYELVSQLQRALGWWE